MVDGGGLKIPKAVFELVRFKRCGFPGNHRKFDLRAKDGDSVRDSGNNGRDLVS
jgi:hypothetical protein